MNISQHEFDKARGEHYWLGFWTGAGAMLFALAASMLLPGCAPVPTRVTVANESTYEVDLESWNALGASLELVDGPADILVIDRGDADSGWLGRAWPGLIAMNAERLDGFPESVARHIACHELGHALGLEHNEDEDSCMNDCEGFTEHGEWAACMADERKTTPSHWDGGDL